MIIYVPGTEETDQKKQNMSLQQLGAAVTALNAGSAKFWAVISVSAGTPSLVSSYNVASISAVSTGKVQINFTVAFSSANWCPQATVDGGASSTQYANIVSKAAGNVVVASLKDIGAGGVFSDPGFYFVSGHGNQ